MSLDDASPRLPPSRPSTSYYLALAAAMVGLVCLAVAIEGTRRTLHGGDGLSALNGAGVPALLLAWALAYYARLAFAERLAPATRAFVRVSLRVLFGLEILAAMAGSWFVLGSGAASSDLISLLVVGDLLQVGTLIWIVRHSG